MLLVLPPSRGQTAAPVGGPGLDLADLSLQELTGRRSELLRALAGSEHDPAGQPTAPAARVFSGVLFAAADLPRVLRGSISGERARRSVLVASPLLGMVGPADPIPRSRLGMGSVDGVGGLGSFWRPALESALDQRARGDLVVDVRSSEFAALWRPPAAASWVTVRVEQEVNGERRVVSHFAKHWRGLLVGHLLMRRGAEPTDARSLLRAVRPLVRSEVLLAAELSPAGRDGHPDVLTLVVGQQGAERGTS